MAWNFLTNHGLVLTYIGRHPECLGLEIALAIGVTERAARKIVAELEGAGYIQRERVGRRNRYHIDPSLPLRHRGERAATVGELLALLWRDDQEQTPAPAGRVPSANGETGGERSQTNMRGVIVSE